MNEYRVFFNNYFKENYKRFSFIAANQIKRFGIRGDIIELQSDVTMSVVTKFLNRYEKDIIGLKELIDSKKLERITKTEITLDHLRVKNESSLYDLLNSNKLKDYNSILLDLNLEDFVNIKSIMKKKKI